MKPVRIDAARLLGDLHALRAIGGQGRGVNRPTYSAADMEARNWLVARMAEAGFDAGIDGIGSVLGCRAASGPAVLTGSHLETHGLAGWLDGAYGVICGLEAARTLAGHPDFADCAVDVIAFADEEAHFGSYLGARSFVGALDDAEIDTARGRADGTHLRVALGRAGLDGLARFRCPPGHYHAFFEAHIEQGDRLEAEGARIGVVSAIAASRLFRIVFTGQANHAGTTSMARRRDAGRAALHALAALDRALSGGLAGPDTVWTVTRIALEPGAASVVPERADVVVQIRDPAPERLEHIETALRAACEEAARAMRCPVEVACIARNDGAAMDPDCAAFSPRPPRGMLRAHGYTCPAVPGMTPSTCRATCRQGCCSCPRSGVSAIIPTRIPPRKISCWAHRSLPRHWRSAWLPRAACEAFFGGWWVMRDSNSRHLRCERSALPLS